jgi:hypothetical protein
MNKNIIVLLLFFLLSSALSAQKRKEIIIPDIGEYKTLKCDFHMHSVFSDGNVWPTIRVEEAWREGLDVIALTEHIEYQPHKQYVDTNHNDAFNVVEPMAKSFDILVIRGSEITRSMPPGHTNAIFLTDCNALDHANYIDAFKAAKAQGAFIFWNHPDWARQQPDTTLWWKEHEELYNNGMLHGIEVANGNTYSPVAHRLCIEKKMTLLGTSDIHNPIGMDYDFAKGEHRPVTLVFAKDKTKDAIKEALFDRRTVVYYKDKLIGEERFLKELFEKSLKVENVSRNGKKISVKVYNPTSIPFELKKIKGNNPNVEFFREQTIGAGEYATFGLFEKTLTSTNTFDLKIEVTNLLTAPEKGLITTLPLKIMNK